MFWFCKKKTGVQEDIIGYPSKEKMAEQISELENRIKGFEKTLEKINNDVPASSFVFDFNTVKVFSIERNFNDNRPATIIGYLLPEPVTTEENGVVIKDVVREWYLYCNQEQHEKLVEQFRKVKYD
jgi:uncharacterized coiled-coil protein SlyX